MSNGSPQLARVQAPINLRNAKKELGMGMPPDSFGCTDDQALVRELCSPSAKLTIVEVADWTVDLPISDTFINTTFGNIVDVWGTSNAKPPGGVTYASNTLATAGLIPSDMIIRGLSVRILVEPEARTIKGNVLTPSPNTAPPFVAPGSPDVFSQNDFLNSLGLPAGAVLTPGDFLFGIPTWKAAYAFMQAYELVWSKTHQDLFIREPLTQSATIQPFAEAEAAGFGFTSNQIAINDLNTQLMALVGAPGFPAFTPFMPVSHERLGSFTRGGLNLGDFTPTREQDAAPTIWGGIGVPQNRLQYDPYLFATPVFWPAGHTMAIQFQVQDPAAQKQFQRWLSLTGGSGGTPGADLALPFSGTPAAPTFAGAGLVPSAISANTMNELTEDTPPVGVEQQDQTNRTTLKAGRMRFEVGLVGVRVPQSWMRLVAMAVQSGAIQAPSGYGPLAAYMQ